MQGRCLFDFIDRVTSTINGGLYELTLASDLLSCIACFDIAIMEVVVISIASERFV